MKNNKMKPHTFNLFLTCIWSILVFSCDTTTDTSIAKQKEKTSENIMLSEETKNYWYSGLAEISSYNLVQQRYGEERKGKAVLVYVTEDFDENQLVKTDQKSKGDFSVLKLNSTKTFNTGIYPYHIMQSSFLPMENNNQVAKISASIQEWCGQSFIMLENRDEMEVQVNSYFQKIGNQNLALSKTQTENGLWNKLRIFPREIDTTQTEILPSFEYLRLNNINVKAYKVRISQTEENELLKTKIHYPSLNRNLEITQELKAPYAILSWEESTTKNDSTYITKAIKVAEMRIDYWNKNQSNHSFLRDSLKL
ncbi:septum formation inhibitor Maf [Psychroflexus planctonicus]|nr:septum formation inhibitor Maf [Psychroflexus planctonicus]